MAYRNRVELDPDSYDSLQELIDETYLDGIDRIDSAWVVDGVGIEAIARDENRQLVVVFDGENISISQTHDDEYTKPLTASFAAPKKRNCVKGMACGGTCIAKSMTCRKKASEKQKAKAQQVISSALVHVPKQVEPSKAEPPKAETKKTKASKGTKTISSDKIKEKALLPETMGNTDGLKDSQIRRLELSIEPNKKFNKMIRSLGEVGDVEKMSAEDISKVLLEVDGESKLDLLGVTRKHYSDKELARRWYKAASLKIHPDHNKRADANAAFDELRSIADNMTA